MKASIVDKGKNRIIPLRRLFEIISQHQIEYNWLITNCECYCKRKEINHIFSREYIWISGEELSRIVNDTDDDEIICIWGVFSGFNKQYKLDEILKYELPFADGYEGFWVDDVCIQHPYADIEIVSWDGMLTLFISKRDELVDLFMSKITEAEDLCARNTRENSEIQRIEQLMIRELNMLENSIDDSTLYKKYDIWRKLFKEHKGTITDQEIIDVIHELVLLN